MTDLPTTRSASSYATAPPSVYAFQPLLPSEVNVDGPAITEAEAYEQRKNVNDGPYGFPDEFPRSPTAQPLEMTNGTTMMYIETPHSYHGKLDEPECFWDDGKNQQREVHYPDGSVFGDREHIQTTGEGDESKATRIILSYALRPDGVGCEWNDRIGFRPIRSTATRETDPTGTFKPVSYEITPVTVEEWDRPLLSIPQTPTSDTDDGRPIGSETCDDGSPTVMRTYLGQNPGGEDVQELVRCQIDRKRYPNDKLPHRRVYHIPADASDVRNTTGFFCDNSRSNRRPTQRGSKASSTRTAFNFLPSPVMYAKKSFWDSLNLPDPSLPDLKSSRS